MIYPQPVVFVDNRYNEVWVPLIYEGIDIGEYLISSYGNVYDLRKNIYVPQHISNTNGYVYINLRHNEKLKSGSLLVHRLVAFNFVAKQFPGQDQVNHINGVKTCNYAYNLEWTTPKENTNHAFETGLAINNIGENSHFAKLSNDQVETICQLLSQGLAYNQILIEIGLEVTPNNMDMIGNIYRRIAWRHISDKYEFPEHDIRFRANPLERIEAICSYLEQGLSNREVYEAVFNKPFVLDKTTKQAYELIRLIRNRKQFVDVSANYNF